MRSSKKYSWCLKMFLESFIQLLTNPFSDQAVELEQNHSRKIESLCEDLKSKAAQEKKERQRIEKLAERYQANLEEVTKLFEDEKNRRIKYESALEQKKSNEVEAEEKGQQDAANKEKLEEMLNDANSTVSSLKFELDRAKAKISSQDAEIMSLQAENALKVAGRYLDGSII